MAMSALERWRPTNPVVDALYARAEFESHLAVDEACGRLATADRLSSGLDDPELPELSRHFWAVQHAVCSYWPGHWPTVEACLSASATLLLKDVVQGLALILVGPSGCGKTTILEWFAGADHVVWRDRFTASAILSGHVNGGRKPRDSDV